MFLLFGILLLKMDFMYFVYFMCWSYVCTQGNMAEQPVAECFTLYKYIGKKTLLELDGLCAVSSRHSDSEPIMALGKINICK